MRDRSQQNAQSIKARLKQINWSLPGRCKRLSIESTKGGQVLALFHCYPITTRYSELEDLARVVILFRDNIWGWQRRWRLEISGITFQLFAEWTWRLYKWKSPPGLSLGLYSWSASWGRKRYEVDVVCWCVSVCPKSRQYMVDIISIFIQTICFFCDTFQDFLTLKRIKTENE